MSEADNKTSDENVANIEELKNCLKTNQTMRLDTIICNREEFYKALERILAEREQKDKRIQELEEENYVQKIQIYENSISKQAIIDLIKCFEKQERLARECIEERVVIADSDSLNYGRAETYSLVIQFLQKLLEGEGK